MREDRAIQTVSDIKARLQDIDRDSFEVLERALSADARKGVIQALESARKRLDAQDAEKQRLLSLYSFEAEVAEGKLVVGLDEVGRGSLAGPLAVAALVLPTDIIIEGLNDSKKILPHKRKLIAHEIKKHALACELSYIAADEIDAVGMSACLRVAFTRALASVEASGFYPEVILLDGNSLSLDARERNIIKGDGRCASIAAASIVAKVERDAYMEQLAAHYPEYGFEANKGYGSGDHIAAIKQHGLCPEHRKSFCTSFLQESLF